MSAHVLMNILNELRKRDKMRGFRIKINFNNNTGVRLLDSIFIMSFDKN